MYVLSCAVLIILFYIYIHDLFCLFKMGSCYVAQAGPRLEKASHPPTSASWATRTHCHSRLRSACGCPGSSINIWWTVLSTEVPLSFLKDPRTALSVSVSRLSVLSHLSVWLHTVLKVQTNQQDNFNKCWKCRTCTATLWIQRKHHIRHGLSSSHPRGLKTRTSDSEMSDSENSAWQTAAVVRVALPCQPATVQC